MGMMDTNYINQTFFALRFPFINTPLILVD